MFDILGGKIGIGMLIGIVIFFMASKVNISSEGSVIFHNVNEIFHLFGKLCSRYIRPFKYVNTAPQHITQ